jgi:hypothetical protein
MIYMDENMTLAAPKIKNQIIDSERWCPGVQIGEMVASPLNPVLYSSNPELFTLCP